MTRYRLLSRLLVAFTVVLGSVLDQPLECSTACLAAKEVVYVSAKDAKNIIVYDFDEGQGSLQPIQTVSLPGEPGALVASPDGRFLFAALRSTGELASLRINPMSGELSLIHRVTAGADPAHISTDRQGRFLLTAYYVAAKISVHAIDSEGRLSDEPVQEIATMEKAHAISLDAGQRFAFVPHTGPNAIFQFRWDNQQGRLQPNDPDRLNTPDRFGPRHLAWHPDSATAYIDNEQGSSVTAYEVVQQTGQLQPHATETTLPDDYSDSNSTAEIKVHPEGRWLYVSNRGHDSIARLAIDETRHQLAWQDTTPTEATPRSFDLSTSGHWLIVAGEGSGALHVYKIAPETGKLTSEHRLEVSPGLWWVMCLKLPN